MNTSPNFPHNVQKASLTPELPGGRALLPLALPVAGVMATAEAPSIGSSATFAAACPAAAITPVVSVRMANPIRIPWCVLLIMIRTLFETSKLQIYSAHDPR
ncbi:hypothetical protein ACFVUS_12290 [Nocardia sp. NPDC058058]|uniref:hypothetical protein n=1 Tax=Nocardia sp. NPDC058058 TaxID=3346317 RepID=UPI0036DCB32B